MKFDKKYHHEWRKNNLKKSKKIKNRYEEKVRKPKRKKIKQEKEKNKYF